MKKLIKYFTPVGAEQKAIAIAFADSNICNNINTIFIPTFKPIL
jgi:hypothetical protein